MIQFADDNTKQEVRDMWKICFGDSDAYMNIYFDHKYRNDNTLIYIKDNKPVASLQMVFYNMSFHGSEIPIAYLSGLCTLPDYRSRGYMKQLIVKSYQVVTEREIPLMVLVPQDMGVMNYYERFGFAQTFDDGIENLPPLSSIIESSNGDIHKAYETFDSYYRDNDMTIQKSFTDFETILEEAQLFNYPSKRNLIGMSRIIDARQLIEIYARRFPGNSIVLRIDDDLIPENKRIFSISNGEVEVVKYKINKEESSVNLHIKDLAQLLIGYRTTERSDPLPSLFPEMKPAMHFMLE